MTTLVSAVGLNLYWNNTVIRVRIWAERRRTGRWR